MFFTSIKSTSTTSWCPKGNRTLIALGSASGTLDASFDTNGELDIYELSCDNSSGGFIGTAKLLGELKSQFKFTNVAWGIGTDMFPSGIIATGIEGGIMNLWDAEKILGMNPNTREASLLDTKVSSDNPTSAITHLEFSPNASEILAMSQSNGEINIWDLSNAGKTPVSKSRFTTSAGLSSISWNKQAPNILGASAYNGEVSIWDTRKQFKIMELKDRGSRLALSSMLWDPSVATRIVTASADDTTPFMCSWDMRNPNSPEAVFRGHEKGVLSMAWCDKDPNLLVSCSKDAKVLLWDAKNCYTIGELSRSSNWVFKVTWSSTCPNLIASSSFDGFVKIDNIILNREYKGTDTSIGQYYRGQGGFVMQTPPAWLRVPSGSAFAYGNKLMSFNASSRSVTIKYVCADPELSSRISLLENVYMQNGKSAIMEICSNRIRAASSIPDTVLRNAEMCQWKLFEYAVFNDINSDMVKCLYTIQRDILNKQVIVKGRDFDAVEKVLDNVRNLCICHSAIGRDNTQNDLSIDNYMATCTDELYEGMNTTEKIETAIYLGDIKTAAYTAVQAGNLADSIIISSLYGSSLLNKIINTCLEMNKDTDPLYMQIVRHIINNDISKLLDNSSFDLRKPESRSALIVIIHRYASDPDEKSRLYSALAEKLLKIDESSDTNKSIDYTTLLCYVASKNPKIVELWYEMINMQENLISPKQNGAFALDSFYFNATQNFMEKIFVYNSLIAPIHSVFGSYEGKQKIDTIFYEYAKYISDIGFFTFANYCLAYLPQHAEQNEVYQNSDTPDVYNHYNLTKLRDRLLNILNADSQGDNLKADKLKSSFSLVTADARPNPYALLQQGEVPYNQQHLGSSNPNSLVFSTPKPSQLATALPQTDQGLRTYTRPSDLEVKNPHSYQRNSIGPTAPVLNTYSQAFNSSGSRGSNMALSVNYNENSNYRRPFNSVISQPLNVAATPSNTYNNFSQHLKSPTHFPLPDTARPVPNVASAVYNPCDDFSGGFNDPPENIFDNVTAAKIPRKKDEALSHSNADVKTQNLMSMAPNPRNSQFIAAPVPETLDPFKYSHIAPPQQSTARVMPPQKDSQYNTVTPPEMSGQSPHYRQSGILPYPTTSSYTNITSYNPLPPPTSQPSTIPPTNPVKLANPVNHPQYHAQNQGVQHTIPSSFNQSYSQEHTYPSLSQQHPGNLQNMQALPNTLSRPYGFEQNFLSGYSKPPPG